MKQVTAVDGHVHIHPLTDAGALLDAVTRNIAQLVGSDALPCLLMTETAQADAFADLRDGRRSALGWTITPTGDAAALLARRNAAQVLLISGFQIITQEWIEVLSLATCERLPDGLSLTETLARLQGQDIPAVLPWGLGKWLGKRGRLTADTDETVLLGDNRGRPLGWPRPRLFANRIVLPGSDPLPITGSEQAAGRYGFLLDGALDPDHPATELIERLVKMRTSPPVFGGRVGPVAALRMQLDLRQGKHSKVQA